MPQVMQPDAFDADLGQHSPPPAPDGVLVGWLVVHAGEGPGRQRPYSTCRASTSTSASGMWTVRSELYFGSRMSSLPPLSRWARRLTRS